jgi:DNA-directed RNA polymerase
MSPKEDLMSTQIRLEEEMTAKGALRYLRNVDKAKAKELEDNTSYGKQTLSGRLDLVSSAIDVWKLDASVGVAGKYQQAYLLIKDIPSTTLSFLALKNILAGVSSVRTLQNVAISIGTAIEDEQRFEDIRLNEKVFYSRLKAGINKRSSYNNKHIYAVRLADRHQAHNSWLPVARLHVGIKMLDIVMETIGLVQIELIKNRKQKSVNYVSALPATIKWIADKNDALSILRPTHEPMVVRPRDWSDPYNGGYVSTNISPLTLVKTRNRAYIEELNNTEIPVVYAGVNNLQHTAWQINSQVREVMDTLWMNQSTLAGLPCQTGAEPPPVPFDIDTNEIAKKEWKIASSKVYLENLKAKGQRVSFSMSLSIANRYEQYRKIYFPYQLDFRGRIYAVPQLNPQGADHQKALLRFADAKPMGTEGAKWLAVHGANLAGYDKVSFEDRIRFIDDNQEEICAIAEDPYNNRGWCGTIGNVEIDKPWQFLAFCFEWAQFLEVGDTFISKLPIAFDGSCSGIQHFSAMLKDSFGGQAVNLTPSDLPADVYQLVADKVIIQATIDSVSGTDDSVKHNEDGSSYVSQGTKSLAKQWLSFGITRKVCKRPVMCVSYGSKQFGFKESVMTDILRPAKFAAERGGKAFPFVHDGYSAANYMAKLIWDSVNVVLIKAGEAMAWLQKVAGVICAEELPIRWTTAIGFPVMQQYADVESRKVKTTLSGKLIYCKMNKAKDNIDRRKSSQSLPPNFVHSCDGAHMLLTVVRAQQEGILNFAAIHDSFGTCAGDSENLFRIVRETFLEIYGELDVLNMFKDEVTLSLPLVKQKLIPETPEQGDLDLSNILSSRFCFA